MSEPPIPPLRDDADATPRPEEVVADAGRDDVPPPQEHPDGGHGGAGQADPPQAQPVAGGSDDGPPAQGEGEPDSY